MTVLTIYIIVCLGQFFVALYFIYHIIGFIYPHCKSSKHFLKFAIKAGMDLYRTQCKVTKKTFLPLFMVKSTILSVSLKALRS